jgi:hypothetical protein
MVRLSSAILHAVSNARRDLKLEVQPQPQAKAKDALMIDTTTTKNKILATGLYLIVFLSIIACERIRINEYR